MRILISQQLLQNLLKGKLDIVLIGEKVFIDDAVRFCEGLYRAFDVGDTLKSYCQ